METTTAIATTTTTTSKATTSSTDTTTTTTLSFVDWTDLQTRLVLLPRVEDEGIGAVVSSYYPPNQHHQHSLGDTTIDDEIQELTETGRHLPDEFLAGFVLVSRNNDGNTTKNEFDFRDTDFAEILAVIRGSPGPLHLVFESMPLVLVSSSTTSEPPSTTDDTTVKTAIALLQHDETTAQCIDNHQVHENDDGNNKNEAVRNDPPKQLPPPTEIHTNQFVFEEEKKSDEDASSSAQPTTKRQIVDDSASSSTSTAVGPMQILQASLSPASINGDESPEAAGGSLAAAAAAATPHTTPTILSSPTFAQWTRRVSAAAAATANSAAAAVARVAAEQQQQRLAAAAVAEAPTTTVPRQDSNRQLTEQERVGLFVRTDTGALWPLESMTVSSASATACAMSSTLCATTTNCNSTSTTTLVPRPSNSTPILVRYSAQEAAPSEWRFQWYRSNPAHAKSVDSSSSSLSGSKDFWELLPGAELAMFQPSATEIGYRLRCVVRIESDDDDEPENNEKISAHPTKSHADAALSTPLLYGCETCHTVIAALPIFNGARQALVRGAQFGGLLGKGNATGRTFCIKIQMSYSSDDEPKRRRSRRRPNATPTVSSAVTIYQVSGSTSEPMHPVENPIRCVTATADHQNATHVALVLPSSLPDGMIAALCTTDPPNRFLLQAPNRLARESILLAIGIANYQGKPADLCADTILYPPNNLSSGLSLADDGSESVTTGENDSISMQSSSSLSTSSLDDPLPPTTIQRPLQSSQSDFLSKGSPGVDAQLHRCSSLGAVLISVDDDATAIGEIQREMQQLRAKLARKDKVVSELQRQVTHSDEICRQSEQKLLSAEASLQQCQNETISLKQSLVVVEKKVSSRDQSIQRIQFELEARNVALESEMLAQRDRIATQEKANRTLQNEKDVLAAAIDAREQRLAKMADLQASFNVVSAKLAQQNEFQKEIEEANRRYSSAREELERIRQLSSIRLEELSSQQDQITLLEQKLLEEANTTASHKSELEKEQMKTQKLKAERNSYKQKGDSLSKEMGRICRNGRSVRDVEKILADDVSRKEEVNLLREQKRRALEQLEHFRTAYEQSLSVQKLAGLDHDSAKLLERNAELERLLSGLTEYLSAKEMQLETMKLVNDALQSEIRELAKANMSKNDI